MFCFFKCENSNTEANTRTQFLTLLSELPRKIASLTTTTKKTKNKERKQTPVKVIERIKDAYI